MTLRVAFTGPSTYVIYGLAHPETGIVRYVGKSCNVTVRLRLGYRASTPVARWLDRLRGRGLKPRVIVFEENGHVDWKIRERHWIKKLRVSGRRLLNVSAGGNGSHTHGPLALKHRQLLGKIPDAHIAERAGLSREAVTYHRQMAGIGPAPRATRRRCVAWFPPGHRPFNRRVSDRALLALVGRMNEAAIAERVGLGRNVVSRRLRRLGVARTRMPRRGHGNNARLTPHDVRRLRSAPPRASVRTLAKRYGVSRSTIYRARAGETWGGVA